MAASLIPHRITRFLPASPAPFTQMLLDDICGNGQEGPLGVGRESGPRFEIPLLVAGQSLQFQDSFPQEMYRMGVGER